MNSVPFISPAWDRIQRSSEDNIAFNLIIKSVENIPKSTPLVQESRRNYIVQIHLYDAVYKQFFGRICRGGIRKEENDNETINFKEEFYFHTSFCDENILLVIEVLEIVNCDEKCAGWTSMRLFRQLDEGLCVNNGVFGLGLFYGSCCSLLYVDSTPDFAPSSEKILGCQIDVSLAVFKPLLKISYLIPENYLVSQRELIPGVRNVNDNSCTLKGMRKLKRISLKPCTSCTIHDLNISIGITIDQFETQLRQHLITQNGQTFSDVEVTERRLQIGCHNGCDFIEEPHTYHLVSGSTSGPTRIASGKRHNWSFRSRQSRNFMLRNKIILNNIPAESGIKLIFVIEYVINISSTDTKIYSRKLNIGIFGAVWEIFPECFKSSSGTKNINLNTGNDDNIQQLLKILLYNAEIDSKETPSIKFSYQIGKKNKSKLRLSIESSDSVSTQTNPSVAVDDERNEEIDSPRVDDVCEVVGNVAQRIHPWGSRKTSGNRLSRSLHCFLSSFAPIIDRWNQPATLVDSEDGDAMDLFAEERDLLKRNEVVLQFLAFKKLNRSSKTRAITISFQFFQFDIYFTESLFLIPTNTPDEPCTLKQMENGKLKQIPEIRFVIDPSHWTNKTHDEFIDYLTKFNVNFDVFDSETQFYLGQCTTPIKNLCRGGREAVEFTRELEIVAPLDPNGVNGVTDDFSREICGYLYCKLGNIGQIADPINQYEFPVNIVKSGSRIGQNDHVIKARSLRDVRESSEKKVNENWEEKLRKLNRMEIVRAAHPDGKMMKLFQDKFPTRTASLKTVQLYREEKKHESIIKMLHENLTTHHSINTTLGDVAFFEFTLSNPFAHPVTITITINDPALKLVESSTEWQHLKRLNNCPGVPEDGFVSYDQAQTSPRVFLHGNESVNIPFKFQMFEWNVNYKVLTSEVVFAPGKIRKEVRVKFNSCADCLVSVLVLDVRIFHPRVQRSFVFFQDAESRLQRCMAVPVGGLREVVAVCSDSSAVTDVIVGEDLKRCNLVLKISVGSIGNPTNLFVFFYTNKPPTSSPLFVWRICIIPLLRIDVTCTLGQTRRCHLVIKGDSNLDRKAACYVSDNNIILDKTHFFFAANQTQQIDVNIKNTSVGSKTYFVNLVDLNDHSLIQSWMICVAANPPIISKVFKVDLQLRRETHKKIHYVNQYAEARMFNLHCTHPDVMKLKEPVLKLGPKQKAIVAIYFPVLELPGPSEVLLFIDSENGKNEDIYKIQIIYDVK